MTIRTGAPRGMLAILGGRAGVVTTGVARSRDMPGFGGFFGRMMFGSARARELRHLASLEPHLLDDIGVTREEVLRELHRR